MKLVQHAALQCVLSYIYNIFNSENPEYFNEICFSVAPSKINTRSSFQRLKQPLKILNKCLNSASYSGPSLWNKLPIKIKRSGNANSFKHNVKKSLFNKNGSYQLVNIFLICGYEH